MKRPITGQEAKELGLSLLSLTKEVKAWSRIYSLNFQFWPDQNTVYIAKGDIDIWDTGGFNTME